MFTRIGNKCSKPVRSECRMVSRSWLHSQPCILLAWTVFIPTWYQIVNIILTLCNEGHYDRYHFRPFLLKKLDPPHQPVQTPATSFLEIFGSNNPPHGRRSASPPELVQRPVFNNPPWKLSPSSPSIPLLQGNKPTQSNPEQGKQSSEAKESSK
jgi:hypothetical protein